MKVRDKAEQEKVDYTGLRPGDCFRYDGETCIKTRFEQDAVVLNTGEVWSDMCGNMVTPVNAEVQIID